MYSTLMILNFRTDIYVQYLNILNFRTDIYVQYLMILNFRTDIYVQYLNDPKFSDRYLCTVP